MAEHSEIQWTDSTFNGWIGCQKVSPGCDNCYAENWDIRFEGGRHWGPHAERRRTGMRTRGCQKLMVPDPICVSISPIVVELPRTSARIALLKPVLVELGGIRLAEEEIEHLAIIDGFAAIACRLDGRWYSHPDVSAAELLGCFLYQAYAKQVFNGVLVKWDPEQRANG